jgi:predicted alpha/beta-fold hydrolase
VHYSFDVDTLTAVPTWAAIPIPSFEPHIVLRGAHAMTIAAAYWPRRFALPRAENRLFRVDVDSQMLGHCHWQAGKRSDAPAIVIVHGLEGSSDSNYVLGIAEKAFARGYHVVRMNQRNCGGTESLTPTLYNSGMSGDYRAILEELAGVDGSTDIFLVGYSMGGNLVMKMAGELGAAAPAALRGVCAVCPSMDLAACADALERPENFLYERRFVAGLLSRYERKCALYPDKYAAVAGLGKIHTVREFDDAITAPSAGYRDAEDYYERASAKNVVGELRVPLLLLTAEDDPFVPYRSFLAAGVGKNPWIRFVAPLHGGHCAFISRHAGAERFWAEQRVVEFCEGVRKSES